MKKVLVISCLLMALFLGLAGVQKVSANTDYQPKLFELRGVWVATVSNIDIKKQFGTTETQINQYKQQYIDILDTLKDTILIRSFSKFVLPMMLFIVQNIMRGVCSY